MTEKIEVTLTYSPDQLKDEIVERAATQYVERLSREHHQELSLIHI